MYDLIMKKRSGGALNEEEIHFMIQGYVAGDIPDYQMAAFLMAVYFKGMTEKETVAMTQAVAHSGDMVDLSGIKGIKVDKHSTGGVGDKTTLIIAPIVAACGVKVAKMSGKGLGHTGGTIDKLESIPGMQTAISQERFFEIVNETGLSVVGQSGNLTPADKKLYALRDVTATVDSIPLIAVSIMSKKLAAGADAIVLDVKTGRGAFMKEEADAMLLAGEMMTIGKNAGRKMMAVISDMDQPLGNAVGNALEVKEAIETLKGHGPADFTELCMTLGSCMLMVAEIAENEQQAREMLKEAVDSGKALDKLAELVEAQGGDKRMVYETDLLPKASSITPLLSEKDGYVEKIQCDEVGTCSLILGGGRETKESAIDLSVGIVLTKKVGSHVKAGEPLAYIHSNEEAKRLACEERLRKAFHIGDKVKKEGAIIHQILK